MLSDVVSMMTLKIVYESQVDSLFRMRNAIRYLNLDSQFPGWTIQNDIRYV